MRCPRTTSVRPRLLEICTPLGLRRAKSCRRRPRDFFVPLSPVRRWRCTEIAKQARDESLTCIEFLVARTGFEPVISALRGRRPKPLDERAVVRRMAGTERIELPLTEPESVVLPLDEVPFPASTREDTIPDVFCHCKRHLQVFSNMLGIDLSRSTIEQREGGLMCHRIVPMQLIEVEYLLEQRRKTGRARMPERDGSVVVPDAYPGKQLPLIVQDESGELVAAERIWGFQSTIGSSSKLVFNTRIETALSQARSGRGMWAAAIADGRCLVPVLAFYESWTRNPPRRGAEVRFGLPGHQAFLLAGVQAENRVSIVTTEPNADVAPLHSRMPLVLGPGESSVWLGNDYASLANRSSIRLFATRPS